MPSPQPARADRPSGGRRALYVTPIAALDHHGRDEQDPSKARGGFRETFDIVPDNTVGKSA
jgi:hypothetical protein